MVESINTQVNLVVDATSYLGLPKYGKIMLGDRGFEFFNDKHVQDFVQIPWEEINYVVASVMFGGRWIPRFTIQTKKNGNYTFASKTPKKTLRGIREHVDPNHMVQALGFFQILRRRLFGTKKKR